MDPTQLARITEALEAQQRWLASLRSQWDTARRIPPGTSTFWSGPSRQVYELVVELIDSDARLASAALTDALAATRRALTTLYSSALHSSTASTQ